MALRHSYRLWCPTTNTVKCARNVIFDESLNIKDWSEFSNLSDMSGVEFFIELLEEKDDAVDGVEKNKESCIEESSDELSVERDIRESSKDGERDSSSSGENVSTRPTRDKKIPKRFEDYEISALLSMVDSRVPETYDEAMNSSESEMWKKAMDEEINAMHNNEVWQLMDEVESQCVDCSVVESRWVYAIKEKNGKKVYRARLVAKEFSSNSNAEDNVYSPVAKHTTLRALLCIANQFKMNVATFDISTAFLHGKIDENKNIFMRHPPGYEKWITLKFSSMEQMY